MKVWNKRRGVQKHFPPKTKDNTYFWRWQIRKIYLKHIKKGKKFEKAGKSVQRGVSNLSQTSKN